MLEEEKEEYLLLRLRVKAKGMAKAERGNPHLGCSSAASLCR